MSKTFSFIRESTGLVREVGKLDGFLLCVMSMVPLGSFIYVATFAPALFPNGYLPLAVLISIPFAVCIAYVYASLTSAMPRSGGDYIFDSRILHPIVGFWQSLTFNVFDVMFTAFNIWVVETYALLLARDLGFPGVYDYWTQTNQFFVLGFVYLVFMGFLMIAGLRAYMRAQIVATVLELVGVCVIVGVMLNYMGGFQSAFNTWAFQYTNLSDSYNYVIQTAVKAGWGNYTGWNLGDFMGSLAVAYTIMGYAFYTTYIGGEVKRASSLRTHLISMCLAAVAGGTIVFVLSYTLVNFVGWQFWGALSYLTVVAPGTLNIPIVAEYPDIMKLVVTNPAVLVLFDIGMIGGMFVINGIILLVATRATLAWSFDRLTPSWLADVSQKFHQPVKAIIVWSIGGAICWYVFNYQSNMFAAFSSASLGLGFCFLITMIAGIVFPFKMKSVYESSPAKKEIAGIPVVTIVGIIAACYIFSNIFMYVINPFLQATSISTASEAIFIGLFVLSCITVYAARAYHLKKEGIDVLWAFHEIPPE